jgi:hypothetical protein
MTTKKTTNYKMRATAFPTGSLNETNDMIAYLLEDIRDLCPDQATAKKKKNVFHKIDFHILGTVHFISNSYKFL